jgi:hypothetical protein
MQEILLCQLVKQVDELFKKTKLNKLTINFIV